MTSETLRCTKCSDEGHLIRVAPGRLAPLHLTRHDHQFRLGRLTPAAAVSSRDDVPQRQPKRAGLPDRFWSKVDRSGGPDACWPWTAATARRGYGQIWVDGGNRTAHRLALEDALGRDLGPDEHACHRCDNPPCCNPAHLFAGTRLDNMRDASRKGRLYAPPPLSHCKNGHDLGTHGSVHRDGRLRCRVCHRLSTQRRRIFGTSHRPALVSGASSEGRVRLTTSMPVDSLEPSSGARARRAVEPPSRSVSGSAGRSRPSTAGEGASAHK